MDTRLRQVHAYIVHISGPWVRVENELVTFWKGGEGMNEVGRSGWED